MSDDPVTGAAAPDDVTAAAASAADAQLEWAALPHPQRAAVLRKAGDLFTQHAEELSAGTARFECSGWDQAQNPERETSSSRAIRETL